MIEHLRYESATAEDIPVIFSQAKALVDDYEDRALIDYSKVMNWLERKITDNISSYTRVKMGERKVAYYRLCRDSEQIELDDFYVLPAFQNMGIGTKILEKCLRETELPVYLYVFSANKGAIALYQRHGFTVTEQVSATRLIMVCQS